MIRVALAGMRGSLRLWVGPLAVVTSAAVLVAWLASYWYSLGTQQATAVLANLGRSIDEARSTSYMLYCIVGVAVVVVLGATTAATVRAQRQHLATLRLAGASPGMVRRMVTLQVLSIAVAGSLLGCLLALPLVQVVVNVLVRMSTRSSAHIDSGAGPAIVLVTVVGTGAVCWIAALRPATIAARTPATAAVRDEPEVVQRMSGGRWAAFGMCALTALMILIATVASASTIGSLSEAFAAGASNAVILGVVLAATVGLLAPVAIPPLMRAWTALIPPAAWPSWFFARQLAFHRFSLSSTTIVPLAIGFGMFTSIFSSVATWQAALESTGTQERLNILDSYVILSAVAIITGIGSVANLFIAGRDREQELALLRCSGARPSFLRTQVALEAFIYVVTAAVLGMIIATIAVLTQATAYVLSGGPFAPRLDLTQLGLLLPVAYAAMLAIVLIPAYSASHKDLRSALDPI